YPLVTGVQTCALPISFDRLPVRANQISPAMGDLIRANREAVERFARLSELRMVPKEGFDTKSGALRSTALFDVRVVYSEAVDSESGRATCRESAKRRR